MNTGTSIKRTTLTRRQKSRLKTDPINYYQNTEEQDKKVKEVLDLILSISC